MSLTWRWLRVLLPVGIFLPIILACPARPLEDPPDTTRQQENRYFPQSIEKDVDLLFLIDNSNSMEPKQNNLQRNFPRFIEALRSEKLGPVAPGAPCTASNRSGCKIPNVRIGIISSDLGAGNFSFNTCEVPGGDGGRLKVGPGKMSPPGCPTPKDPWIMYSEGPGGTIVTNVQNAKSADPVEQVKEAFSCVAYLGAGGCGFEHQLESAKRALEGCQYPNAACKTNPGFIRPDAYLAIVFVTDEDDCSARKGDLFDPSQQGLNDPLGPLTSFRCFEFGIVCDKKGRQPGPRNNCVPGLDYLYSVDAYTEFFRGLKPPGRVLLFALAGPTQPVEVGLDGVNPTLKASCNSPNGMGVPAIRMATVVKSFGEQGHFNEGLIGDKKVEVNICASDFTPALQLLGEVIVASLGGQCLSAPPLTKTGSLACHAGDVLGPGATCTTSCLDKVDCVVEEKVGMSAPVSIKQCSPALFDPAVKQNACGSECPCWRVVPVAECKPTKDGSPYGLQIMRAGEAQKGAMAIVRCATTPFAWGSAEFAKMDQCK
jgi:hypothetical protein